MNFTLSDDLNLKEIRETEFRGSVHLLPSVWGSSCHLVTEGSGNFNNPFHCNIGMVMLVWIPPLFLLSIYFPVVSRPKNSVGQFSQFVNLFGSRIFFFLADEKFFWCTSLGEFLVMSTWIESFKLIELVLWLQVRELCISYVSLRKLTYPQWNNFERINLKWKDKRVIRQNPGKLYIYCLLVKNRLLTQFTRVALT